MYAAGFESAAICHNVPVTSPAPVPGVPLLAASTRSILTVVGAALLSLAAVTDSWVAALVVVVLAAAFAYGWPLLTGAPAARGSSVVILLAAVAAAAVAAALGTSDRMAEVVAFGVIAAFVREMARTDGRERMVESVSGTVTGVVVVVSGAGWVLADAVPGGTEAVLVSCAGLIVAAALTILPVPGAVGAALAAVGGGAVGTALGVVLPAVGLVPGMLIGLVGGALVAFSHVLFNAFPAACRPGAATAAALLPLLAFGVPVHLVAALTS